MPPTQENQPDEQKKKLIETNSNIILTKSYIESAKRRNVYGILLWSLGGILVAIFLVDLFAFRWQGIAPYVKYAIALGALASLGFGIYMNSTPGVIFDNFPNDLKKSMKLKDLESPRRTASQLELELQFLREEKRISHETIALDVGQHRAAYKEDALVYIEELRKESNFYRRVSNFFQVIIIAGASASTLGAGTSYFINQLSVGVAIASFFIAVASSLTGYFKYKERSFYAQQTADAVEHEIEAFELGVGKYKNISEADGTTRDKALEAFAQEIHRLRQDQKMREQNLDQPSSKGEENGK